MSVENIDLQLKLKENNKLTLFLLISLLSIIQNLFTRRCGGRAISFSGGIDFVSEEKEIQIEIRMN